MKCPCCGGVARKIALVDIPRIILFDGRVIVTRPAQCEIFRRLLRGPICGPWNEPKTFHVHMTGLRRALYASRWPCVIVREKEANRYVLKWDSDAEAA